VSRWGEENPEEKQTTVDDVFDLYRQGKFKDNPFMEIKWEWETPGEELIEGVKSSMDGFRGGKGIFVFGKT
jgi:trans-2-enoyl-CoA reductase